MYMSLPQLEQILKDRQASAKHSARRVSAKTARPTGRRIRTPIT